MFISLISLSNGEDFITTEQLQRRMKNLSSPSSSVNFPQSNISSNSLQKELDDKDNDCFLNNGLPEDSSPTKDEDKANEVRGTKTLYKFLCYFIVFFLYSHVLYYNIIYILYILYSFRFDGS